MDNIEYIVFLSKNKSNKLTHKLFKFNKIKYEKCMETIEKIKNKYGIKIILYSFVENFLSKNKHIKFGYKRNNRTKYVKYDTFYIKITNSYFVKKKNFIDIINKNYYNLYNSIFQKLGLEEIKLITTYESRKTKSMKANTQTGFVDLDAQVSKEVYKYNNKVFYDKYSDVFYSNYVNMLNIKHISDSDEKLNEKIYKFLVSKKEKEFFNQIDKEDLFVKIRKRVNSYSQSQEIYIENKQKELFEISMNLGTEFSGFNFLIGFAYATNLELQKIYNLSIRFHTKSKIMKLVNSINKKHKFKLPIDVLDVCYEPPNLKDKFKYILSDEVGRYIISVPPGLKMTWGHTGTVNIFKEFSKENMGAYELKLRLSNIKGLVNVFIKRFDKQWNFINDFTEYIKVSDGIIRFKRRSLIGKYNIYYEQLGILVESDELNVSGCNIDCASLITIQ